MVFMNDPLFLAYGTLTEVYWHVHNEKFLDKVLSETSRILEVMQYLDLPKSQMVKYLPAMLETQIQSLGEEDPLKKGTATYSSILAWGIPWREEPDGLQPMGSQRVGHDLMTNTTTAWEDGWNRLFASCQPPNSQVDPLTHNEMVFGFGEVIGFRRGREGWDYKKRKRDQISLSLSGMPGRELSPDSELTGSSVLNFSASGTVRYKFLLL